MIVGVAHDDAPLAVEQIGARTVELPISTALAADGSYGAAVAVAQHLHSISVKHDDAASKTKRDVCGEVKLVIT